MRRPRYAGKGKRKQKPGGLRETVASLRVYMLLVAAVTVVSARVAISHAPTNVTWMALAIYQIVVAVGYIFLALLLPRIIAWGRFLVIFAFVLSLAGEIMTFALGFATDHSSPIFLLRLPVAIGIALYLSIHVIRLSAEYRGEVPTPATAGGVLIEEIGSRRRFMALAGTLSVLILGLGVLAVTEIVAFYRAGGHLATGVRSQEEIERERAARASGGIYAIAPAPIPHGLPLLGTDTRDSEGYPTQYVDRAALRSLLFHRRFEDLDKAMEAFQSCFEADPKCEYLPQDAADAFEVDPVLEPSLDAWVQKAPASFGAYLARGSYRLELAYRTRGAEVGARTASSDLVAMQKVARTALADLERAVSLKPKSVPAYRALIRLSNLLEDAKARGDKAFASALAVCPNCYLVRTAYAMHLFPRWSGDIATLRAFIKGVTPAKNSRLVRLRGFEDYDHADTLVYSDPAGAITALEKACALGPQWLFHGKRSEAKMRLQHYADALTDLDIALSDRRQESALLYRRAEAHLELEHFKEAGEDLLLAMRLSPVAFDAKRLQARVGNALARRANELHLHNQEDQAIQLYDLLAEVMPGHASIEKGRATVLLSKGDPVNVLRDALAANPDDFRVHQRLDYALSREDKVEEILGMWTKYVTRHPDDGRAYVEREGAYARLNMPKEGMADARRACELGFSAGCMRFQKLGGVF